MDIKFKELLTKESTLLAPHFENKKFNSLLDNALANYTISQKQESVPDILWGEERYGLLRSSFFRNLPSDSKKNVYKELTRGNLAMSWYIERSGHNYGAKMILLSESQEEKSLYSLFVAEEAIHQREFENFMTFTPDPNLYWHPLLDSLAFAIQEGEKQTCLYVIQVLLEGFGIAFYNGLKQTCLSDNLKTVYQKIINDEAKHHGSGVIQTQGMTPNKLVKEQVFEYTRLFLRSLVSADLIRKNIEKEKEMSSSEKSKFYEEIDFKKLMNQRLHKLKTMLQKVDNWDLVASLEKDKVFTFL